MDLGKFSISLTVKDINKSLNFYKKLGFEVIDGGHMNRAYPDSENEKWRILSNSSVVIGLMQGVFERNMLTFHPPDVLALHDMLRKTGMKFKQEAGGTDEGPVYFMLEDPDGNPLLFDQV